VERKFIKGNQRELERQLMRW